MYACTEGLNYNNNDRRFNHMKFLKTFTAASLAALLAGCSGSASYKAGTYSATVMGHNENLTVEVTVSETAITEVKVTEQQETAGIADAALEQIPAAIVQANSPDVDAVSGCTDTSEAIIEAVKSALTQAKG
jgi:fumarate reductase flavoprotein subunit